jgi:hypothetical protein
MSPDPCVPFLQRSSSSLKFRGVIHAQGARIRAQGAPGYVHKEQAHIRGSRLTGNFIPKRVILLPNPAVLERDLHLKLGWSSHREIYLPNPVIYGGKYALFASPTALNTLT